MVSFSTNSDIVVAQESKSGKLVANCHSLQVFMCFYLVQYLSWQGLLCLSFSFQMWEGDTSHLISNLHMKNKRRALTVEGPGYLEGWLLT